MLRPHLYAEMIQATLGASFGDARRVDLWSEVDRINAATGIAPLSIACDLMGGRSGMHCQGPTKGPYANAYRYCVEQCPIRLTRNPRTGSA